MSDHLSPIERIPLITTVMERIQQLIEERGLTASDRLPSERQLREGLGVGRSTVREALRALEALGMIEVMQGRGAFVRQRSETEDTDVPGRRKTLTEDWSQLSAVVETRMLIETEAARLAATRRTAPQLGRMEKALKTFHAAMQTTDLPALVLADVEFHLAVAEAANPVLAHCLRSLGVLAVKSRQLSLRRADRHAHVESRHSAIYKAIAASNPAAAAKAMSGHLSDFTAELGLTLGDHLLGPGRDRLKQFEALENAMKVEQATSVGRLR